MINENLLKDYVKYILNENNNFVDEYPINPEPAEINPSENAPLSLPNKQKKRPKKSYVEIVKKIIMLGTIPAAISAGMLAKAKEADLAPTKDNVKQIEQIITVSQAQSTESPNLKAIKKLVPSPQAKVKPASKAKKISISFKEYNDNEAFNFMLKKESFRSSPYVDKGNISIGYGSNIDKDGNSRDKNGKALGKANAYNFKGKGRKASMRSATNLALKTYGIGRVAKKGKYKITKKEGLKIAKIAWNNHKSILIKNNPWVNQLPGQVKAVCVDMSYNVGTNVFGLFKDAKKFLVAASKNYEDFIRTGDIKSAKLLKENLKKLILELKDSKAYKDTKKARDNYLKNNPKSASWNTRFEEHINKIQNVINKIEEATSQNNKNESYSLKSVYGNLFS